MGLSDSKFHGFVGKAQKITEHDIAAAAQKLGTKWSRLHGVMEVEASFKRPGDGFDRVGRPKMLFEPHHFYRALQLRGKSSLLPKALKLDIARPGQPPPSWYSNKSYWRLVQALELDETGALVSCSWGFGQVMGFNWKAAGFQNVQDMVFACMDRESAHLQAMCGYIASVQNCLYGIRYGDAVKFALGYNGANYAAGGYHTKIAAAWRKWEKMPYPVNDGQLSPAPATPVPMPKTEPLPEPSPVPIPSPNDLPEPKPELQTKRIQGLAIAAIGLIGGAIAKKWFPASEGMFQSFLISYGGEITAAIGVLWSYVGNKMAEAPIKGTQLAQDICNVKGMLANVQRDSQSFASRYPIEDAESSPVPPEPVEPVVVTAPLDLMTASIEEVVEQLPQLFERIQRIQGTLSAINQARLPMPSPRSLESNPNPNP